ncbi:MAG: hypothetical protein MPK11_01360 [Gammaproteobacteria bacterium]|nr:hypothetical protein [Gammaproteobacteria bacterium]MDA7995215.1 hypothetical protein [Gammaproteobacteria bacterium]MDA8024150.1 hypothetical protein [Gammaproteobacteria bacterium]
MQFFIHHFFAFVSLRLILRLLFVSASALARSFSALSPLQDLHRADEQNSKAENNTGAGQQHILNDFKNTARRAGNDRAIKQRSLRLRKLRKRNGQRRLHKPQRQTGKSHQAAYHNSVSGVASNS